MFWAIRGRAYAKRENCYKIFWIEDFRHQCVSFDIVDQFIFYNKKSLMDRQPSNNYSVDLLLKSDGEKKKD